MINKLQDSKPLLKWVGGKRKLIPEIRKYYENLSFNKYIEPFFGGGSVYINIIESFEDKLNNKTIINDINTDLINLYKHVKSSPESIIEECIKLEKVYYEKGYYYLRDKYNGINTNRYEGIERSSCLIVLNRTCFNGLYRVNKKGLFNVPEGRYKNPRIIDEENLFKLNQILPSEKNIRNCNFDEIEEIQKGDLVYFDPPYHPLNKTSSFTDYSGVFREKEQLDLKNYFKKLDDKGVFVILSNSSSEFIRELYQDFFIDEVMMGRSINSKSKKRGSVKEFLIIGNTLIKELGL